MTFGRDVATILPMNDLPYDIRLWLMTAPLETGVLDRDNAPLPVAHDALQRGLVRNSGGEWVLTRLGRETLNEMLADE
jgi:hypothetical protein